MLPNMFLVLRTQNGDISFFSKVTLTLSLPEPPVRRVVPGPIFAGLYLRNEAVSGTLVATVGKNMKF